ncbi:hypothetical protein [Methylomicrobium agile]|uniref:hypothetical protein n=1 Tax=Methylomicrobium agile TaxID=39774 RepID=UPI0014701D6F|nr:hypothetical protein [Methylomicrobium agile]
MVLDFRALGEAKNMIENIEEVKNQLKELSEVINSFTSEAVQLRIIDLVFNAQQKKALDITAQEPEHIPPRPKRKRIKSKVRSLSTDRAANGEGPVSILTKLAESAFFEQPQSIRSIIEYCEVNFAKKIRQSDISGKLAKMVREGILKREKNAEGQYEYSKP